MKIKTYKCKVILKKSIKGLKRLFVEGHHLEGITT